MSICGACRRITPELTPYNSLPTIARAGSGDLLAPQPQRQPHRNSLHPPQHYPLFHRSSTRGACKFILAILPSALTRLGLEQYYPSPALHYEAQPSSQYCDFVPPSSPRTTFPPPPTYTPLQQQQPWIGMTLVDPPPPSIFTAILEETEEHSSARMMSGDGAALFDLSMPFFGGGGEAAEPFPTASPFLQLPTPLATPTTSTSHSPWSVHSTATSSSICASFPPNPILYSSPKSSLVAPSSAELAPLNTSPLYLLLLHSTTSSTPQLEVHELKILLSSSSDLGAERPILRLGWFEFEGDKEPLRVFDAIKREGEGEGEVWLELLGTEGGGESEGGRILFFDVGTYSVPAVDGEKGAPMIGSGEWWRAQVCWGHVRPSSPLLPYSLLLLLLLSDAPVSLPSSPR